MEIIGELTPGSLYHVTQATWLLKNLMSMGPGGQIVEVSLRAALRCRYGPVPPAMLPVLSRRLA